jgi:uncharacterized membrane protein
MLALFDEQTARGEKILGSVHHIFLRHYLERPGVKDSFRRWNITKVLCGRESLLTVDGLEFITAGAIAESWCN